MKDLSMITISLMTIAIPALYGVLGSVGFYIHEISQDPNAFDWRALFIYAFLGVVVGLLVHNMMLDLLNTSYPGVLIAAGFSVRKLTDISDKYLGLKLKLPKK